MDWQQFAQAWGPAVPMFLVICYFLKRLIDRTIPSGFRRIREALETLDMRSEERQERNIQALHELGDKIDQVASAIPPEAKPDRPKEH